MKIGRNDICPCGSGKKHKKCCLDKPIYQFTQETFLDAELDVNPFFEDHNSFDLLQSIAGLTLLPENHGKYVRLEILSQEIIKSYNTKEELASAESLNFFLENEYPSNHLEDLPVNLFTDLITFYGGDYLIFPGITENSSLILTNQLTSIFQFPNNNIPEQFKSNCFHVASLILCISNTIAKKLNFSRYQVGTSEKDKIHFPNNAYLKKLKEAVTFSEYEMHQLLAENKIVSEALEIFLIEINSSEFNNPNIEENPLIYKPILHFDGKYLIVSPATLSLALTNFIWSSAERCGCMKEVNEAYHNTVWTRLQMQLKTMNFNRIEDKAIIEKNEFQINEGLYQFDDDKIAYIQLIYDSGNNFNGSQRISSIGNIKTFETIESHKNEVVKKIFLRPEYKNFQLIHFTIISSIGRDFYYPIQRTENARTIAMDLPDFDVLYELKETDAIDLWKFSIAREEQLPENKMPNFSFLDQFKLYKDYNDSYYLSDETKYNMVHIQPGYSASMVRDGKLKTDRHSVLIETKNALETISIERKDKYAPVYLNVNQIAGNELQFVVEGFYQPIWIKPKLMTSGKSGKLRDIYWEINDAIAYWLCQIQDECKGELKLLGSYPLTISFELSPIEKFEEIERKFIRDENLSDKFHTIVTKTSLNVAIPSEIIPYLYGSDNEGERVLVKHLFLGFNKLLAINSIPLSFEERIEHIIERKVPLGMKKKFFILDTSDNLMLDPANLQGHRFVQEYDINIVLNSILPTLGSLCPPIGEILDQKHKDDLSFKIVQNALLPILRSKIQQYDSTKLLKRFISLNESVIRKREELRVLTPTRIACFVNVEQHQIDLQESLSDVNRTSLALRCLIEHVAAEPTKGNMNISITAIDELVAIMDQVISWGSLSDQIHFNLFDVKMFVLPSGRIGTQKNYIKDVFDPYYKSKTKENVIDAISTFKQVFPQNENLKGKDVPENLDKAFIVDFGISFTRICQFIEGLCHIGFQQSTPYASLPLVALRDEVNKYVDDFDETEFQNAVNYLALSNRGKLEKLPKGYEFIDIMPWRFNRMLSFIRKPIVLVDAESKGDSKIAYWGVRQLLASRMYLGDQMFSDRLRVFENSEVKKVLGKFAQQRGDALVKKIVDSIDPTGLIIDQDVYIGPGHSLKYSIDIGDIDILVIDTNRKILFSLECKSMSPSRNIKEMIEEVEKLFGSQTEMGWIDKHVRRHQWLEANRQQISTKYNTDITDFAIKSIFITNEDMLTPHLRKQVLKIPFITSYEIEENGYHSLLKY